MIRSLMGGVAVLALISGTAFAQDSSNTYYSRTVTQASPFGSSRSTTTTTTRSQGPMANEDADADEAPPPPMAAVPPPPPPGYGREYDEQSADIGNPPPDAVGPSSEETTTTRRYDPDGSQTHTYQRRQTYYDGDGELSAHTTTRTQSHTTTYGPPVVYAPTQGPGPAPSLDLPPRQRTTTTTTITDDGE